MVRAWYMSNDIKDQQLENHRDPPRILTIDEVYQMSGVEYFAINPSTFQTDGILDGIKKRRGYTYEDELICSKDCLSDYEEKLKIFFTEHLHTDEEIRFILEGSGYFDVRDKNDEWIRIEVTSGDMIVLPSGIYHRFTLDMGNFIKVKRFFIGEPVWISHNRPADHLECRKNYLEKLNSTYISV